MLSRLKSIGILLSKVLLILMGGLALGFGAYQGIQVMREPAPVYSVIEPGKQSYEPVNVKLAEEPLKPSVGNAIETEDKTKLPVLVLSPENTLTFNEVVTDKSVAELQVKLQEMSNKLAKDKEIILVLYTPGGSVDAGMQLIDSLQAVPQKVKTLTLFAASMGFQFVQNMDERMITPSGVLMSHRAYGGMEGEIGGEFDVRLNSVKRQILYMDTIASRRMKMSVEDYRTLIRDEYWVHGFESVEDRAADKLVLARCSEKMSGKEEKEFPTLFGTFKVTFSKCPLITGPLEVKLEGIAEERQNEVRDFTTLLYSNPREFYKQFIKTEKYQQILKK